ncbi:MAG: Uma2 family endonuclease [Cyanobacteria bacterium P01_G01_bin.39]
MRSPINLITVEEYLKLEQDAEICHEYVAGQIYAMAGASEAHNLIVGNVFAILRPHLRGSSCRTFVSDMKVKVKTQQADIFYYPDLLVTCDPNDNQKYFKISPNLIVEVLFDSTETTDKREKRCDPAAVSAAKERASRQRINYQTIDSLKEYILVSQDEIKVEIYRKDNQGNWTAEIYRKDDNLALDSVGLTLTMADIYEDIFSL